MKIQNEHLAIATVPVQNWGELYDQDNALKIGTIFKDLDLPFFAAEKIPESLPSGRDLLGNSQEQKCGAKLTEIQKVSFVADDLRLYLDTHPDDPDALSMLKTVLGQRKRMLSEFAAEFYPLTMDCMAEGCQKDTASTCYCWAEGPAPWEGVCC